MKKLFLFIILFNISLLSACSSNTIKNVDNENYNHDLFYKNNLELMGADPSVIYVNEGEEEGYYYMYITSDAIDVSGYLAYRSKDLTNWECVGTVLERYDYVDENNNRYLSFGTFDYWAPEVIYDSNDKLYYMFYSANSYDAKPGDDYHFYGDVAISDSPKGPFIPYNAYYKNDPILWNKKYNTYIYKPLFDFSLMEQSNPLYEKKTEGYMKIIDLCPFIDPKTNDKYVYFTRDLYPEAGIVNSKIYVIKCDENWQPNYNEVYYLTTPNKISVDDESERQILKEGKVNEGPYMVYHNNKYYLLYSACSYNQKQYSVRVAISDSPIGPFKKLEPDNGGYLLYAESKNTWVGGTGHCSIVSKEGKDYIVYHAHQTNTNEFTRGIAKDEIHWTKNKDGIDVMVCNGPSYALLPNTSGEYKNIVNQVNISSKNDNNTLVYLYDGIVLYHDLPFLNEAKFKKGEEKIIIGFGDNVAISSISIFNSFYEELRLDKIDNIKFKCNNKAIETGPIIFDIEKYTDKYGNYIPGGSFSVELDNEKVTEIEIIINNNKNYNLSEIVILSK